MKPDGSTEQRITLRQALTIAESLRDDWSVARLQASLAELEFAAGNARLAVDLAERGLAAARRARAGRQITAASLALAALLICAGEFGRANEAASEALMLARADGDAFAVTRAIEALAAVAAVHDRPVGAARLLGYADASHRRTSYRRTASEERSYGISRTCIEERLGRDTMAKLAADGESLSEARAAEEALAAVCRIRSR